MLHSQTMASGGVDTLADEEGCIRVGWQLRALVHISVVDLLSVCYCYIGDGICGGLVRETAVWVPGQNSLVLYMA
jgi:hypothetical protein